MASASDIVKRIKEEEIEWVDLRFTDPKGKWQHLTMVSTVLGEDELEDGLMFDGSSIEGWKAINESDMILKPDLDAVYTDPFSATPMLILFCDIVEPSTGDLYGRDPRSTAKRAEAFVKSGGFGDTVYVGPEAEFFMFDDVRFYDGYNGNGFKIDDVELPGNSEREYDAGNLAHRPRAKGGYFPVPPVDSMMDVRAEMVSTMIEMGLPCDKHHHEVAAAQHELGLTFGTLVTTAFSSPSSSPPSRCEIASSIRTCGTISPPIFENRLTRPVILRNPSSSSSPMSPVLYQPSPIADFGGSVLGIGLATLVLGQLATGASVWRVLRIDPIEATTTQGLLR